MNILILMMPMALLLGVGFVFSFIWAVDQGQFEDVETPAHRILDPTDLKSEREEIDVERTRNERTDKV